MNTNIPINRNVLQDALDTIKEATAKVNQLKEERTELIEALDAANSRLLAIKLKQEDTLKYGLDQGFGNLEQDLEMTERAYEISKAILKKYSKEPA